MKKILNAVFLVMVCSVMGHAYNTKVYTEQGGAKQVVKSGGEIEVQSGGLIDLQAGSTLTVNAAATLNIVTTPTFSNVTVTYGVGAATGVFSGAVSAATLDTGNGAHELFLMEEDLGQSNSPTWANATLTGGISAVTATLTGAASMFTINATSAITAGWYIQAISRTEAQLLTIRPTVKGQMYFCSDCTAPAMVVSTGTTELGQFALVDGTTFD